MDKIQAVQEDKDPYSSKLQRIQIGNWQCEKENMVTNTNLCYDSIRSNNPGPSSSIKQHNCKKRRKKNIKTKIWCMLLKKLEIDIRWSDFCLPSLPKSITPACGFFWNSLLGVPYSCRITFGRITHRWWGTNIWSWRIWYCCIKISCH